MEGRRRPVRVGERLPVLGRRGESIGGVFWTSSKHSNDAIAFPGDGIKKYHYLCFFFHDSCDWSYFCVKIKTFVKFQLNGYQSNVWGQNQRCSADAPK